VHDYRRNGMPVVRQKVPAEEGKQKGKAGRPKIVIDWDLVQKLSHIQCTQAEIATAVGVSVDTLHRHPEFAEAHKRGAEGGRKSIRRMQFESATKGSIAMQIWLGKQYLGQRDNLDQRVNTELQIRADFSKLDDAELAELERLTNKACAQTIDVTPVALPAAPDEQVSTGDQTQERSEPTLLAPSGANGDE
jgi:hypothetical protein